MEICLEAWDILGDRGVCPGTKEACEVEVLMHRLDSCLIRPAHRGDLRFHSCFFLSGMIPPTHGPCF